MAPSPKVLAWRSRSIIEKPENFSPGEEPSWPQNFDPTPDYTLYENPDHNEIIMELFLTQKPNENELALLTKTIEDFLGAKITPLFFAKLRDRDWVKENQQAMKPLKAGRYFVFNAHDSGNIPKGTVPLQIEASMAFGTGHHETTKGCLLALDKLAEIVAPSQALDLGCGSGILAFAMSKIWNKAYVMATEIDRLALKIARKNAYINDCQNVEFIYSNGFASPDFSNKSFDVITANILAEPLIGLAPELAAHTKTKGTVILSGLLDSQGNDVVDAYVSQGVNLQEKILLNKWLVLILQKA